jgi:hypothetical protein
MTQITQIRQKLSCLEETPVIDYLKASPLSKALSLNFWTRASITALVFNLRSSADR